MSFARLILVLYAFFFVYVSTHTHIYIHTKKKKKKHFSPFLVVAMRSKAPLPLGRRFRNGRVARRIIWGVLIAIFGLVGLLSYTIYHSLGDGEDVVPISGVSGVGHVTQPPNTDTLPTAVAEQQRQSNATVPAGGVPTAAPDAMPYSESLDELLQLLHIYTTMRGIKVNQSLLDAAAAGGGMAQGEMSALPLELSLPGVQELRMNTTAAAEAGLLHSQWLLDDPADIQKEQEDYVARYIAPVQQPDVALTPLGVLRAYYDPQSPRSLHHLAAATEKSMNDDGYATFIQRSATFYDPSHAARRGYGMEGTIFVAVPFTLNDITPDMVTAIAARAAAASTQNAAVTPQAAMAALRHPLDGADDAASVRDVDGFREIQRTAARCAMTVESVFRQAHNGIGVTVGTVDVVVVSGIASAAEADLAMPSDVRWPITEEQRANASATRPRRYDRITCAPPNFRSGWEDASYGFSWKDNLRQRRVLVPLTQLQGMRATSSSAADAITSAPVGRYATLELYRGESYIFFLRPGSLAMPNWDLKLRLLYLRTPQHQRAVLSSRPTPGVAWQALAAAIVKAWRQQPYLPFSSLTGATVNDTVTNRNSNNNSKDNAVTNAGLGADQTNVPSLDWTGRRLLQTFPSSVAAWLEEARGESALALWLVTPQWLWPALVDAVRESRAMAAGQKASVAPAQQPSLRDLFNAAVLADVLGGEATAATPELDLDSVVVVAAAGAAEGGAAANKKQSQAGRAQVHGAGTQTRTSQPILTDSLTEAEVYKLLFLSKKRPPMPDEPILDMGKLTTTVSNANADVAAPEAAGDVNQETVQCGIASMPLPYFSSKDNALVKRAFEYCWMSRRQAVLRALAERLTHATEAFTLLTSPSTAAPYLETQGGVAAATDVPHAGVPSPTPFTAVSVKCGGNDGQSALSWYTTTLLSREMASQCLADMRYLDPGETPLVHRNSTIVPAEQQAAVAAWMTSAANAGRRCGSHGIAKKTAADATRPLGSDTAAAMQATTPYVLQSVASADLLFGPAEAFFDFPPEDRLRTRAASLAEQMGKSKNNESVAGATEGARYANTPEPVVLDPSLHYLDNGAVDLYLTTALWTRGWNIFGLTEAVVGGDAPPTQAAAGTTTTDNGATCGLTEGTETAGAVPEAVRAAKDFAVEKLWALMDTHRSAGTPLGPVHALSAEEARAARTRFPLRRTLQEYEAFANLKLDDLRKK